MKTNFHSIAGSARRMRVVRLRGNLTPPPPQKHDGRAVGGLCAALCAILEGGRRAGRIKGQKGRKRLKGRFPWRHFRPSSPLAFPMSLAFLFGARTERRSRRVVIGARQSVGHRPAFRRAMLSRSRTSLQSARRLSTVRKCPCNLREANRTARNHQFPRFNTKNHLKTFIFGTGNRRIMYD